MQGPAQVDQPQAHLLARPGLQPLGGREGLAVDDEGAAELAHHLDVVAGVLGVPLRLGRARPGADDQDAVQPLRLLGGRVVVGVVDERPGRGGAELVGEALAPLDGGLRDVRHAVHRVGDAGPVEVEHGVLRELVRDRDAQPVALGDAEQATGELVVVDPGLLEHAGEHLPAHGAGGEGEHPGLPVQGEGQRLVALPLGGHGDGVGGVVGPALGAGGGASGGAVLRPAAGAALAGATAAPAPTTRVPATPDSRWPRREQ